jgi:hypothetical protein
LSLCPFPTPNPHLSNSDINTVQHSTHRCAGVRMCGVLMCRFADVWTCEYVGTCMFLCCWKCVDASMKS